MRQLPNILVDDNRELSLKSLELLYAQVQFFFSKNKIINYWIPDIEKEFPERLGEVDCVDIILFGGFLERYFEFSRWPSKKYRFWCLSQSVKNVLVNLLFVPEKNINVVSRYEIFPSANVMKSWPKKNDEISFVYAGRISSHKNIELLIYLVFYLQVSHGLKIKLYLMGPDDNLTHRYRPLSVLGDFRVKILALIKHLPWIIQPEYLGDLPSREWIKEKFENPIFISLSTYICEDFSVSAAQAQAVGWPTIVSDWGGLRDLVGPVKFISLDKLSTTFDSLELTKLKAKNLAKELAVGLFNNDVMVDLKKKTEWNSEYISKSELDELLKKTRIRWGEGTNLIGEKQMEMYFIENSGREFLDQYFQNFSGMGLSLLLS